GPVVQTPASGWVGVSSVWLLIGARSIAGDQTRESPVKCGMRVTLVRSATIVVELNGRRILVDPMLDPAGARPPIANTANAVGNPTVELPFPAQEIVRSL